MSFLIQNWYWLAAAVVSGAALLWPMLAGGGAQGISVQDAVQLINREKGVLIDLSPASDYAAGHVAGARNVPLDALATTKGLPSNKTLPLVLICAAGQRSQQALAAVTALGHQRVHVLHGGLSAWREANLPVEKSA
ncbi:MAG: rhodanese-like domain-containing protein [Leptothrix sp. (in: b-proteobacteria)]